MKAIVTRQNPDGSFDEVGMNNRTVFGPYRAQRTIEKLAAEFAGRRGYRVELYRTDSIYGEPDDVRFYKPSAEV